MIIGPGKVPVAVIRTATWKSHLQRSCTVLDGVFRDTSAEALHEQTLALRRLGGAGRLRTACMMSQTLVELAKARIREQHPEFDERAVLVQLVFERYGVRLER